MVKRFGSANLKSNGTIEVRGPFTLDAGDPKSPALVSFYLVQPSDEVDDDGNPKLITVRGDGRSSVGDETWEGTCEGGRLKLGEVWGYGMAVLVQEDPPGFATWTWQSPLEVTGASST